MPANVQLEAKEILEREFKTSMKGYNKEEVDQFLDTIIQDYELFQDQVDKLEKEVGQLRKMQTATGPQRSQRSQAPPADAEPSETDEAPATATTGGSTNYDILKRISNLEKEVFGKKLSQ
ncbi:cell division regulator GpsB [Natribacillus halophilus]|uniref:DivIVA domain-containing protein n=1 Tax=Natribacillus halophilus TaxID=549003 RepID=A0A1G8J656_9BACI|nr:cell division regulator GpsB [Natribacillus halophilus]SDI26734.1 DivIVA domain-containing protein [Natribacillus halophilus]